MRIDSHVHFWKYDSKDYPWIDDSMKVLKKDHLPGELEQTLRRSQIDGCIAVQAAPSTLETRFLAELAGTHDIVKAVIGWVDLQSDQVEQSLTELKEQYPSVKGIRHIVQDEPDDFMYNEEFRRGIALLEHFEYPYDILVYPSQLQAAIDLAASFPTVRFVLDHCGKPDIAKKQLDPWRSDLAELALLPNTCCKLSGLLTEASWKSWSAGDFYPYFDAVFESFSPNRILYGSDWPVMLLSGIYVQWKSLVDKYMENLIPEERDMVLGGNAARVYGIK